MKIAFVCPLYYPCIGGVETHVKEISERLVRLGHTVQILTTDYPGNLDSIEQINGVAVNRFPCWAPRQSYYFSPMLRKYIKRHLEEYDIVHSHSFNTIPALYVAWAHRKKAFSVFTPHFHGGGHTPFRSLLYVPFSWVARQEFFKSDVVVCVSNYEKSLILSKYSLGQDKAKIVPNGVDIEDFSSVLSEALKPRDPNLILCVSRLEGYKRIDVIIRSLKYLGEDYRLEIVGVGPDKARLENLVRELDLQSKVLFLQNLSRRELILKYAEASVFVLLSKKEAYGMTVVEAMLAGTPCVVANNSALSEWIDNKNCYDALNPEDPTAVAMQIKKVSGTTVSTPPKVMDWNQVTEKLLEIYERGCDKT